MKPVFCVAPWMHFHVDQQGDVRPCCMYSNFDMSFGNVNKTPWQDIWEGELFSEFRFQMLRGETPKECKKCLMYEEAGGFSLKKGFSNLVPAVSVREYVRKPRIVSVDIRTDNICNGRCCQCNEWNSTSIAVENGKEHPRVCFTKQGEENLLDLLKENRMYIKSIALAGGETLMVPSTYKILDVFKNRGFTGSLTVFYNSNGSVTGLGDKEIFDYADDFTFITSEISLDGIGKAAEYIRNNIPWEVVEKNLEKYYRWFLDRRGTEHAVSLTVHPTVFVHSVLRIPELLQYLDEKFPELIVIPGNFLQGPDYFDLQRLPQEIKDFLVKRLQEDVEKAKLRRSRDYIQSMISYILEETDKECKWEECKAAIRDLDTKRGLDFLEINPEFKPWF